MLLIATIDIDTSSIDGTNSIDHIDSIKGTSHRQQQQRSIVSSNMAVSKVDEIIAAFPQQPTRIEGQPTYATIAELKETLKINAASIPCTLGGAAHGYLGVIISETMYATYSDQ
jgi:hypothetical protein